MLTMKPRRLANIVKGFSKVKILVVGDVMLDEYIWGKVSRISPEAPVPVVNVHHETRTPGGAANVAHNIYGLKAKAYLASVIGDDIRGKYLIKLLHKNQVNVQGLIKNKSISTILKTRIIAHNQQVVRIDKENGFMVQQKDLDKTFRYIKKIITEVDGVIIEDYGKNFINQEIVRYLVDICHKHDKPLVADPKKGHSLDYTGVTTITPNLEEAKAIVGLDHNDEYVPEQVEDIGQKIMDKWKPKSVLITLGEHGMGFFEKDKASILIPTMARDVYDVSGAGDTVVGVFTTSLVSGATMREAAVLSNMAAGIVVGKIGTAIATKEELLDAIKGNSE